MEDEMFFTNALRKRGRNDLCWCLSGVKYKYCHLNRESKEKIEFGQALHINYGIFNDKKCLHPDKENCSGKRIRAHTIQRNGGLKKITDTSNHVLRIARNPMGENDPEQIGWKNASTFYGFCEKHDGSTFAPLETTPFSGSKEQCFLLYYRALCYEHYNKEALVEIFKTHKMSIDNGFSLERQIRVQQELNHYISEFGRTVQELKAEKEIADSYLLQNVFSNYAHLIIYFSGTLDLVTSSHFHLSYDLLGNQIYNLSDKSVFAEGASFSIFDIEENRGAVIVSWNKNYKYVNAFIDGLLEIKPNIQLNILHQLMFAQSENVFFSFDWWSCLSDDKKEFINHLSYNTGENYACELRSETCLHNWTFESMQKVNV